MNQSSVQACARLGGISNTLLLKSALQPYKIKSINECVESSKGLESLESSETREEFALPTFTMCNYQAHSKHKIKDLYPFVRTRLLLSKTLTLRFFQ